MSWFSRRYRGITCYFGLPGAGKSYELARWGQSQLQAGRRVFCSAGFDLVGAERFSTVDEFVRIPDGAAICWDEAPVWLDARRWSRMDPTVLYRLTQVRKYGCELRYSAIHPSMVEVTLRRVTFDWIEVRGVIGPVNRYRAAKSPEGSPKIRLEHGPWHYRKMRPEVWAGFDTTATADVGSWAPVSPSVAQLREEP